MEPWWYEYVKEAIECIDRNDYVEAKDILKEIVSYGLED